MSSDAVARLLRWKRDPLRFVRECLGVEPDLWQQDVLRAFPTNTHIAMKACKGPGKTAVLAWLIWNFLLTRRNSKVAATSITGDNLADGLWTELAKWQAKSPVLTHEFTWSKTRIVWRDDPREWWASARTWPKGGSREDQANSLAGLHADNMLFVVDEVGAIPNSVLSAAEMSLANAGEKGREAHLVIAGNPTHLEGPLYDAFTKDRSIWHLTEITADPEDPKRTPRVPADFARQQIQKWGGRGNPWVMCNILGKFPPSSLNSLLGVEEVQEAMKRKPKANAYEGAAKILGVDVAREGDDASVIARRQGICASWIPKVVRNWDSVQGAGLVAQEWRDFEADACFVDASGGFGAGWVDQLRLLGRSPTGIQFAGEALDSDRYANARAEMHFALAKWVKEGGALPDMPELAAELTTPTYSFQGDRFLIEPKDSIKDRLGRSPDIADALALTFAQPVVPRAITETKRAERAARRRQADPLAGF